MIGVIIKFSMNIRYLVLFFFTLLFSTLYSTAYAVSFTADAVQIRGDVMSYAKLFWRDGQVRFEYIEDGVPMAQIFDTKNKKIIWLDNENKLYLEKEMPESEKVLAEIKSKKTYDPCKQFVKAECVHLKETTIDDRKVDKWLITLEQDGNDYHIFQWVDKQYKTIVRQENSDGSALVVKIIDEQTINERKVRKLDMVAFAVNGQQIHGIQWYDNELDIVVRQQYRDDFVDELRNIKVKAVKEAMFVVPEDYEIYEDLVQTAQKSDLGQ